MQTRDWTLIMILFLCVSLVAITAAKTVYVSPGAATPGTITFGEAVVDPEVTEIVLTSNYTLEHDLDAYSTAPYQLTRNVTVTGLHGTDDVLDLQFIYRKIQLCDTCIWTWRNVTVANERRGGSPAWDLIVGPDIGPAFPVDGRAFVFSNNIIRWRWSCPQSKYSKDIMWTIQRPSVLPKPIGRQEPSIGAVTWQGRLYDDALLMYDYGSIIPRSVQEGRGATGGYGVWDRNVTRLCMYPIGPECLEVKSAEACINERIDKVLADLAAAKAAAPGKLSPGRLAATVVLPTLGIAAVAAVLGVTWRRRRRHRQRRQYDGKQLLQLPYTGDDSGNNVLRWLDAENGQGSGHDSAHIDYQGPLAVKRGWELTSSHTNPSVGDIEDGRVVFGELLGAGSFGRVYEGSWGGRTVAIKVIEYDMSSMAEVQNEVQLILSFNHPNIVQAYHCVTYTCTGATGSGAKGSGHSGRQKVIAPAAAAAAAVGQKDGSSEGSTAVLLHTQNETGAAVPQTAKQPWIKSPSRFLQKLPGSSNSSSSPASAIQLDQASADSSDSQRQQSQPLQHSEQVDPVKMNSAKHRNLVTVLAALLKPPGGSTADAATAVHAQGETVGLNNSLGLGQIEQRQSGDAGVQELRDQQNWKSVHEQGTAQSATARTPTQTDRDQECWTVCEQKTEGSGRQFVPGVIVGPSRVETWLVQEFCDRGTLGSVATELREERRSENMLKLVMLLLDVANGLKVLHARNTVHGDLNARNVLVATNPSASNGYTAKLADLGLARVILKHRTHRTTDTVGTMSHMPPELLRYGKQSPAGDIYAFGIMMWELYTGAQAFKSLHYGQFFTEIVLNNVRPPLPAGMPADYLLLMDHCWAADPADRPTVDRLLQCISFMIQERRKSPTSSRRSSAVLPVTRSPSNTLSSAESGTRGSWGNSSTSVAAAGASRHVGTLSNLGRPGSD